MSGGIDSGAGQAPCLQTARQAADQDCTAGTSLLEGSGSSRGGGRPAATHIAAAGRAQVASQTLNIAFEGL